ncbi:transcriptional regulator [Caballeronia temeraria]|uniref:Transcriptional regulator n=1 Tax=Caballeronia temeraria TaxID=1777137 RepID=A0A158CS24_9BURK|nr:hypothetical protein [Caballeronia temeraria]SAK84397.1 transcriptional regulator [Caballeronia temeraria]
MNRSNHYRGYAVHPTAHRLRDKSFSANVLLERSNGEQTDTQYRFYSLDYFSKESDALDFSKRWAREWIDARG